MKGSDLVGKCFHSIVDDTVQWQGVVIGRPEPGWYLLELFSWVMGEHGNQRLVRIEEMRGWLFYSDADEMNYSYEYGAARPYRVDLRRNEAVPEKEKPAAVMSIFS
jgi:hypothetical protein